MILVSGRKVTHSICTAVKPVFEEVALLLLGSEVRRSVMVVIGVGVGECDGEDVFLPCETVEAE